MTKIFLDKSGWESNYVRMAFDLAPANFRFK